jgi:hypothetical protein
MDACHLPGHFDGLGSSLVCGSGAPTKTKKLISLKNHTTKKVAGDAQSQESSCSKAGNSHQTLRSKMLAKGRIKYGSDPDAKPHALETGAGAENDCVSIKHKSDLQLQAKHPTHNGEGHSKQESTQEQKPEPKRTALSEKMVQKRAQVKTERSVERKKRKTMPKGKMDWSRLDIGDIRLDLRGHPIISFDPKTKDHAAIIKILEKKPANKLRKAVMAKLTSEMGRIYHRYLIMRKNANNLARTDAIDPALYARYAGHVAVRCLYQGITPRQLLEYWEEHLSDFANCDLKYPTLSFLSGPHAAEQVASAVFEETGGGKKKWKPGDFKRRKDDSHSFSDTDTLDKRLRRGLVKAGFNVRACDDRYLMTIQQTARTIAKGHKIFVSEPIRGMVEWAVEHLYGDEE